MLSQDGHPIWDEYEWESHINEMARRHQQLRHIMEPDAENRPRWLHHLREAPTKLDAVDAYIEEELMIEETHFPFFDDLEDDDFDEDADELYDDSEGQDSEAQDDADFYNNLENLEELFQSEDQEGALYEDQSEKTEFDDEQAEEFITEGSAE